MRKVIPHTADNKYIFLRFEKDTVSVKQNIKLPKYKIIESIGTNYNQDYKFVCSNTIHVHI